MAGKQTIRRLVLEEGRTQAEAAALVGVSRRTVSAFLKGHRTNATPRKDARAGEDPIVLLSKLPPEAKRALEDFAYFRRRYFGRISTPWQEQAAYRLVEFLETPTKEYVVVNCPPGSGKSTLFTHDIPVWLIVRNRAIRIILFSKTQRKAKDYCLQIRRSLERTSPVKQSTELIDSGRALDAEACLAQDFGRFKPAERDLWRNEEFVVAQHGDQTITEKDPTVSSWGPDSGFLGTRAEFLICDDVVDSSDTSNEHAVAKSHMVYDDQIESRLEPGGVCVLQGQRLHAEDLYRHKLNETEGDAEAGEEVKPKYHHIVYKAHDEERCEEDHGKDAKYWPDGCLLDPKRLTWKELRSLQINKEQKYRVLYQQEDVDPAFVLVPSLWVKGGVDPVTGEQHPGCWDEDRGLGEIPQGLAAPVYSIATVDPSAKKFWAVEWWLVQPSTHQRFLIDITRQSMDAPDFLDWLDGAKTFVGLANDWQIRSKEMGYPISHWIVEANATQKHLMQYEHARRWCAKHSTTFVPHTTTGRVHYTTSSPNADFGIEMLKNPYRYGQVRLPGHRVRGRKAAVQLVYEVTHYPETTTTDCMMAQYFLEFRIPMLATPKNVTKKPWRPSFMKRAA